MSEKILVFVPCYNCAPQIARVLAQFDATTARYFDEVLVLDNGSRDGALQAAIAGAERCAVARVTIGRNKENYNLGGSHKVAFAYARAKGFTHVVVLHGDDQGHIGDLLPVLQNGAHRDHDACLGARFAKGSRISGYSRFRVIGNRVFNLLASLAAGRRVLDLGSGLNIFAARVFEDPALIRYADDLRFNVFLLLGMYDAGRKLIFFPIGWREDDQISNVKLSSQALKTLQIFADFAFRRTKFRNADFRDTPRESYPFEIAFARGAS